MVLYTSYKRKGKRDSERRNSGSDKERFEEDKDKRIK